MFHQKEEEAEREKAHTFIKQFQAGILDYEFSDPRLYNPIDLFFTGRYREYSAEIKVRNNTLRKVSG